MYLICLVYFLLNIFGVPSQPSTIPEPSPMFTPRALHVRQIIRRTDFDRMPRIRKPRNTKRKRTKNKKRQGQTRKNINKKENRSERVSFFSSSSTIHCIFCLSRPIHCIFCPSRPVHCIFWSQKPWSKTWSKIWPQIWPKTWWLVSVRISMSHSIFLQTSIHSMERKPYLTKIQSKKSNQKQIPDKSLRKPPKKTSKAVLKFI